MRAYHVPQNDADLSVSCNEQYYRKNDFGLKLVSSVTELECDKDKGVVEYGVVISFGTENQYRKMRTRNPSPVGFVRKLRYDQCNEGRHDKQYRQYNGCLE